MGLIETTVGEDKVITTLENLAKRWPKTLWLFAADAQIYVMKKEKGQHVIAEFEGVDPDYVVATIHIDADGGDW